MIGVLFTVLVQSSSTCTSVIVSLVASETIDVKTAIPMVMGANIGTSMTSTLVSLSYIASRDQFERAFAAATVHDCFNWLAVFVLLILELATGFLFHMTEAIAGINSTNSTLGSGKKLKIPNILDELTDPLTDSVIRIDKKILKCWGEGKCEDDRLLKIHCSDSNKKVSLYQSSS